MYVFVDEVGCASLFSCVYTAAVAVESDFHPIDGVKDSKKLSKKKREELYNVIREKVIYDFGASSPKKIEQLNIHYAKYDAMRRAVLKLLKRGIKIDKIIVDGKFPIPNLSLPQEPIIKADDKFNACSCASILAKVERDRIVSKLGELEKYKPYDLSNNAGYFSPKHREGIILHGPTKLHRLNFDYTKYCIFCHEQYNKFVAQGKTYEEYLEYEKQEEKKYGKSFYLIWKQEYRNIWKEIRYGQKINNWNYRFSY